MFFFSYCIASPKTTPRNYRMLYIGLKDFSSSKYDFQILLNMSLKGTLALMFEKGTCPGYSVVFDVQGYSFGHLLAMHISLVKKFMYFIQVLEKIIRNCEINRVDAGDVRALI